MPLANRIDRFLKLMNDRGASDLHLAVGRPPMFRLNGLMDPIRYRARPAFRREIDRLGCAANLGAVLCLLCAEEDPLRCHRFKYFSSYAEYQGSSQSRFSLAGAPR